MIRYYNLLYFCQDKTNGRAYLLDNDLQKLPNIYILEQSPKRFDIDESLLKQINVSEGLTMEQATELLKWTVNNTRDNMNFSSKKNSVVFNDVYDNNSLMGFCGFSQFSSLYPLQQLGLEITINNMMDVCELCHCYGTVTIPIRVNGQIIKKDF